MKKIIISLIIVLMAVISFNNFNQDLKDENKERLKISIEKAAVACFASEGFYPEELDYLIDNYHVVCDFDKYNIYYKSDGANFKPRVEVFERNSYEKE